MHLMRDAFPPSLAIVTALCRVRCPQLLALPHIVDDISDMADPTHIWSIVDACKAGSLRLLRRVAYREQARAPDNPPVDPFYRDWKFNQGLEHAAARGDLGMVQWLVLSYLPGAQITHATYAAIENGHVDVLSWLMREDRAGYVVFDASLIEVAARKGHIAVARWIRESRGRKQWKPYDLTDEVFAEAPLGYLQWAVAENERRYKCNGTELETVTKQRRLDVIQWLAGLLDDVYKRSQKKKGAQTDDSCELISAGFPVVVDLDKVVKSGRLDVIQWLCTANFAWLNVQATGRAIPLAVESGHLDVAKWLHANRSDGDERGCDISRVIRTENLELLKWVHWNISKGTSTLEAAAAADIGRLDIIKFLHEHRPNELYTSAIDRAAANGHLNVIEFLHANRSEGCTPKAIEGAATNGHFSVVKFLTANFPKTRSGFENCSHAAIDGAAANGHLDIVLWIERHFSLVISSEVMDQAAGNGHLEMIRWLHENRSATCTTKAMNSAAANGHLQLIKWLHDSQTKGCTTTAMDSAAMNGHLEVVKWLHENRSEGCTTWAMNAAAKNGHLVIVKWLHENRSEGCTTNAMDNAAKSGHLEVVMWLHENRSEGCTTDAMDGAAEAENFEMLTFLQTNRSEGCSYVAFIRAGVTNRFEVLRWLSKHYRGAFESYCFMEALHYRGYKARRMLNWVRHFAFLSDTR